MNGDARGALIEAETMASRALGNANAARTDASRSRWEAVAQRWLDRANDLREGAPVQVKRSKTDRRRGTRAGRRDDRSSRGRRVVST